MQTEYQKGYEKAKQTFQKRITELNKHHQDELAHIDICKVYPYNVLLEVLEEASDDYSLHYYSPKLIEDVISKELSERESKVLYLRYGLGYSLEETGKEFGVTKERIRQIEAKALRKLRHPNRIQAMRVIPFEEHKQVCTENAQLKKQVEILTYQLNEKNNTKSSSNEIIAKVSVESRPLEELNLSIRSYNCLKRAFCNTVGDVKKLIDDGTLERVRNLGKKSYIDVVEKINEVCK